MKKNFLLLFLMALLPLAGWAVGNLNGTTQYGENGLKYKILTIYNTETATKQNTVSVSQNVYATNGSASIVIPATVTINVQGTDDEATPVAINKAVTFKVVEIEANGFQNVTTGGGANVTAIQIGANIATIGANAFDGCSNVTSITFDANTNNVAIADDAFKGTKVTSLDLTPLANMTTVNKWFNSAYAYPATSNNTLTSVTFPSKLTNIVADAFGGCKKLATVTFPVTGLAAATYLTIGAGAFSETAIVDLDLTEAKIQTLNKLFEDNNVTLNTVKMAKSVVTLAANALANCIQLNSVDFSKAVNLTTLNGGSLSNTVVAEYDFSNCYTLNAAGTACSTFLNFTAAANPFVNGTTTVNKNLTKVTLPYDATLAYSPVTVISTAFANCEALTEVEYLEVSKITTVDAGAFAGDIALTELSFPATVTNVNAAFGAGANLKGCEKLAKLTFDGSAAGFTIGDATNPIYGAAALYSGVYPLEELYITVPATTVLTSTNATIAANALTNNGAESKLYKVEIAKDGIFAGTINNFALAEGEDAEVTFGNIAAGATLTGQITGPTGTKATELTVGDYALTAAQALVTNKISEATVGAVNDGSVLTFIGQAVEIEFTGAITAIAAPAAVNAVLTTIDFNDVTIPAGAVVATAFDENNAPLLTSVTWTPTDANATKAFNQAAFGTASVGAAAKVTLHTTTAVATLYTFSEANLFNVIFDATAAPVVPTTITVTGTASATYFYGKASFAAITKIAKETDDGDQVTVYSAFVDDSDNKIYMDPLAIVDGYYVVAANEPVVIRMKNPTNAVDMTDADAGYVEGSKKAEVVVIADATATPTMRYDNTAAVVNDLEISPILFSSDYIGTNYVGKTLYAMKNPAKVGALDWGKVNKTSYLPANSLFVQCNESAAARLETIWLDGTENVTAIQNIIDKKAAQNGAGVIYNLAGQKVGANYKGIIIKDGKKYFNK